MGVKHEQKYEQVKPVKVKYNIDLGYQYGQNNHLTVIELLGYVKARKQQFYKVYCPICAEDTELFGDGTFVIAKGHIVEGKSPCGCSKSYKCTKEQWEVRLQRKLEGSNCEFAGWTEGGFKNSYSKVILRNKINGEEWATTTVDAIMQGSGYTRRGFRSEDDACFYVLEALDNNGNEVFIGFGVTGNLEQRKRQHKHELKKRGLVLGGVIKYDMIGWKAEEIEKKVIYNFPKSGTDVQAFVSESTLPRYRADLIMFVESIIEKEATDLLQQPPVQLRNFQIETLTQPQLA